MEAYDVALIPIITGLVGVFTQLGLMFVLNIIKIAQGG